MNKKGESLPLNMVVIFIIVSIVLALVIYFLVTGSKEANRNLFECEASGKGKCVQQGSCDTIRLPDKCPNQGEICCSLQK